MIISNIADKRIKNYGHRQRLRERFLKGGLEAFLDYEIIELLLTLGTPRRDCKNMAKAAMSKFKSLQGVLDASVDELGKIKGIGPSNVFGLKLFQALSLRIAKEKMPNRIELRSIPQVAEFLIKKIGSEKREHFVALYLDSGSRLISEKIISIGTLDMSLVQPREVFEPAILKRATMIVIAHNHPSGKISPSIEDRDITRQLVETGRVMGIEILDHLIVTGTEYFSFKHELIL